MTDRLRVRAPTGLLHQSPGELPRVEWSHEFKEGECEPSPEELRCLELDALLAWGHGIWTPRKYHFRLPSGDHSGTFIRIANALVDPRAAAVLASWFDPHIAEETGLIVDSGRLTGLVLAIQQRTGRVGRVEILEDYPITSFDITSVVKEVAKVSRTILGVISVSSSGSLMSKLVTSLDAAVGPGRSKVAVLVDRQARVAPQLDTWMNLPDAADPALSSASCSLCLEPARSFLIAIDPKTFDGMLPYQTRFQRPSVQAQQRNRTFWEVASPHLGLEEDPHPQVMENRPRRRSMSIKVRWDGLVSDDRLMPRIVDRLAQLDDINREFVGHKGYLEFTRKADLVLCPDHEAALQGHRTLIEQITASLNLGAPPIEAFPTRSVEVWPQALQDRVAEASGILMVALGAVTGRTIDRAKRAIQEAKSVQPGKRYSVQALVIHARPENSRDYRNLWNVLDHRLYSVWLSYIPTGSSPLQEENELLQALTQSGAKLSSAANEFLQHRLAITRGIGRPGQSVFWGFPPDAATTPYALSGHLDATGAYAATGTAIHETRTKEPPQLPERDVFDMAGIVRSYFDDVLLAGFLRWIRPHEMGWMTETDSTEDTLQQLLGRTADGDKRAGLLAELLLAAALGKIPRIDHPYLLAETDVMLTHAPSDAPWRGALELGVALLHPGPREADGTAPRGAPPS